MMEFSDELPNADAVVTLRKYENFWTVALYTHTQRDPDWEVATMRTLADMIERDYVPRYEYDRMRRSRDEWKARAEGRAGSSSVKRAAAMDRLEEVVVFSDYNVLHALIDGLPANHNWRELKIGLLDLLSDVDSANVEAGSAAKSLSDLSGMLKDEPQEGDVVE